jgi:hypothetical protein
MFNIPLRTSTENPTPKEKRKTERTKEGGIAAQKTWKRAN